MVTLARRRETPAPLLETPAALAAALLLDRALGEPPAVLHPVAAFGRLMQSAERLMWADRRGAGGRYALAGVAVAAVAGRILALGRRRPSRAAGLAAATYVAVAGRALEEAAGAVEEALASGDLAAARERLRALVGRDVTRLDEAEIVRAVVESVAENTVDAVTAPLLWAAAAGAPGVLGYRAVNTLDAMVGHRSARYERFGWASARADDVANWFPARLTAAAVAAARPARARAVWRAVRVQAPLHPSPNAGVVEAAFAAALDVRLGGTNDYAGRIETRPALGTGRPPRRADIGRAMRLSRQATWVVWALAAIGTKGQGKLGRNALLRTVGRPA